ncbi:related to RRP14 Protein involved in Ribosomal RNA Processing [Phialocephala subalpina]|uniref:Related to RRP14 Protein involved in Ribosomal RNA Processing n=1 Tax=Phialocephala subalpina TaxID=576137 RepID=A0A1L7WXH0_9HELO|nr:related to RRP14 Protein involved in Ribosomal RNA Processing [Phialocephala subalpina]
MAESSLQDRLREHAAAFDGLLSLIPAKYYYGEDTSDQWKKKKQTKEQAAAARRAKLDPDSAKTAKDVMDERARKRKLEELEDMGGSDIEGVEKEQPKEGLRIPQEKKSKKQKIAGNQDTTQAAKETPPKKQKANDDEQRKLKQERKQEKKLKKKEKGKAKVNGSLAAADSEPVTLEEAEDKEADAMDEGGEEQVAEDVEQADDEMAHIEVDGLEEKHEGEQHESASPSPSPPSPTFDNPTEPSANTSTSSVIPPATAPKHIKLPTDPELLRSRLNARIEALRAARKADGPDGRPARNRQELLEARRKKEEQRKAHKKELRMKAKEEEDAHREAALASARDSPASSMMSPAIHSPEHNFSFGRVSFADGQELAENLTSLKNAPRKRGSQDVATALLASENKRKRIAGLDEEKRADIEEKDLWLNAKKRAHGEKVRDDTSLLKKTLKRKEKAKKKSEKEWTERKEGVAKSQAMKQKKREENLQKRRDEKGSKGKGKGKGKSVKSKKPRVKSRPGFEGSFGSGKRK